MSDEKLIELWSSSLTDIGRECANEELARRDRAPLEIETAPIDRTSVVRQNVTVSLIKEDNRVSLQFAFLGIGLLFVGILIRSGLTFFFGWMLLSGAVAYYAKAKGRNPAWSLPSFFLSPVIGVLVVACLPARPRFTCSGCDHAQAKGDRICAGCGKAVAPFAGSVGSIEAFIYRCPTCGAAVSANTTKCPECCALLGCKV